MFSHKHNIFLFLTHKGSAPVLANFNNLLLTGRESGEARILFHQKSDAVPESVYKLNPFLFSDHNLAQLNYIPIAESLLPGSNHFPLLAFYLNYPDYAYYWCIEDDVVFNGDWDYFFAAFQNYPHDFVSCHIRSYDEEPDWFWWNSLLHPDEFIPKNKRIRSFNPIYRISNRALAFIHRALTDYWAGHHEVVFPTLLHENGFTIMDFGGDGSFVLQENKNLFYTSSQSNGNGVLTEGTMRFRPSWNITGNEKNKLYHPVKADVSNR